jgi:hypothetical protein
MVRPKGREHLFFQMDLTFQDGLSLMRLTVQTATFSLRPASMREGLRITLSKGSAKKKAVTTHLREYTNTAREPKAV